MFGLDDLSTASERICMVLGGRVLTGGTGTPQRYRTVWDTPRLPALELSSEQALCGRKPQGQLSAQAGKASGQRTTPSPGPEPTGTVPGPHLCMGGQGPQPPEGHTLWGLPASAPALCLLQRSDAEILLNIRVSAPSPQLPTSLKDPEPC